MTAGGASYQIVDEPRPSSLSHLAVNPMWPLLAIMFGGAWLSWPWFALNGFAVGSPSRRRELLLALGGFAGSFVILLGLGFLLGAGLVGDIGMRYLSVALIVWKLAVSYWLFMLQGRAFGLFEHFGGVARNGMLVVLVAFYATTRFAPSLSGLWRAILL